MTFDRTLVYATGGVAWMHGKSTLASTIACAACASWTRTGGVVGGGAEWKPDPNWSVRLEGLYYFFNSNIGLPGPGSGNPELGPPTDQLRNAAVVRAGFSWYPNWSR
jgi:opacity protein-like surface antigen